MKLTRYSGRRHNRERFAWLKRCCFGRTLPTPWHGLGEWPHCVATGRQAQDIQGGSPPRIAPDVLA